MRAYPLFSPEDSDLNNVEWHFDTSGYARKCYRKNGVYSMVYAHCEVIKRITGKSTNIRLVSDHINRVKIDCQRSNLRLVTQVVNATNVKRRFLPYVTRAKGRKSFLAQFIHFGKCYYCGSFKTMDEAYNASASKRKSLGLYVCPKEGNTK